MHSAGGLRPGSAEKGVLPGLASDMLVLVCIKSFGGKHPDKLPPLNVKVDLDKIKGLK